MCSSPMQLRIMQCFLGNKDACDREELHIVIYLA